MRDLRLAARLVAGGGRAQVARLALMTVGLAFGILALLLVIQVPQVLHGRDEVLRSREPVPATGAQRGELTVFANHGSWHGRPLLRVFVSGPADALTPPGVAALPRPGEVVLSPAAARLRTRPDFATLVPGRVVGQLTQPGLTGPDELVAYLGVDPAENGLGQQTLGWGVPAGVSVAGTGQFEFVTVEAALLVVPTAVIYVLACGRLAAATRRRRYAALRLVGASRRTLATVATAEAATAAVLGTVVGLLLFAALNGPLGASGLMGLTWYAEQSRFGVGSAVLVVLTALLVARVAGGLSGRRAMVDPLQERRFVTDRRPPWWLAVPLLAGIGLLLPLLPFGSTGAQGPAVQVLLVSGAVVGAVGVLLSGRLLTQAVARRLASPAAPLGVRLGAARLLSENARAVWLVSGLALLLLVSATGSGLTKAAEQQASSATRPVAVHVYGNEVPPEVRPRLADLGGPDLSWASATSRTVSDDSEPVDTLEWKIQHLGVQLLIAGCPQLGTLLGIAGADCERDHLYRLQAGNSLVPLPAGRSVTFETGTGSPEVVVAPADSLSTDRVSPLSSQTSLVWTGSEPPGGWSASTTFYFVIPPGIDSLDRFASALSDLAPTATANSSLDLVALAAYRQHRAAIQLGVGVGYTLALFALLISLVDRNIERRRDVVALVVLGTPARTIRLGQLVFGAVPALSSGLLAVGVGWLIANAFGALDADDPRWSATALTASLPLAAIGLVVTAASSLLVVGLRPRAADLRRE